MFGAEEKSATPNDDFFRRYAKMPTHDVFCPCDALTLTLTLHPNPTMGSDAFGAPLIRPLRGRIRPFPIFIFWNT